MTGQLLGAAAAGRLSDYRGQARPGEVRFDTGKSEAFPRPAQSIGGFDRFAADAEPDLPYGRRSSASPVRQSAGRCIRG